MSAADVSWRPRSTSAPTGEMLSSTRSLAKGFDQHHRAVAARAPWRRARPGGHRIAHVVQAVEEADEVVARAGIVVGACAANGSCRCPTPASLRSLRLRDGIGMGVEAVETRALERPAPSAWSNGRGRSRYRRPWRRPSSLSTTPSSAGSHSGTRLPRSRRCGRTRRRRNRAGRHDRPRGCPCRCGTLRAPCPRRPTSRPARPAHGGMKTGLSSSASTNACSGVSS